MTLKVVDLDDVKCILGHTNIGLFKHHLIDTTITDLPLTLTAICITHGHGDHFTWARTIKRRTGAIVVAPKEDAMLIENPEINVRGLFNWARSPIEMTTRFFLGEACQVDSFVEGLHLRRGSRLFTCWGTLLDIRGTSAMGSFSLVMCCIQRKCGKNMHCPIR